jgi:hypothetical protein
MAEKKKVKRNVVSKVPAAVPSKISIKGTSYKVNQTATGKIRLTAPSGNTVTFPKGVTSGQIAAQMSQGKTLFGDIAGKLGGKTGKPKAPRGGFKGGIGGGMFGIKNR